MVKITNEIKVLYKVYSKEVKLEDHLGVLYLFNNNSLLSADDAIIISDYIFTGVAIEPLNDLVKLEVLDNNYNKLEYALHKNFICVKVNDINCDEPIAVLSFSPATSHWVGDLFYAHFIEIN